MNPDREAEVPALRRWGALLLGAAFIFPAGVIAALAATDGVVRVFGGLGAAFGVWIAAGAFAPRLLSFRGRAVPPAAGLLAVGGAGNLVAGSPLLGLLSLAAALSLIAARRE